MVPEIKINYQNCVKCFLTCIMGGKSLQTMQFYMQRSLRSYQGPRWPSSQRVWGKNQSKFFWYVWIKIESQEEEENISLSVRESLRLQYIRHAVGLRGRSHPERRAGVRSETSSWKGCGFDSGGSRDPNSPSERRCAGSLHCWLLCFMGKDKSISPETFIPYYIRADWT